MPPLEQQEFIFEPIKGFPYLHWKGKQPYTSTQFFPAKSNTCVGEEQDSWINRLYWGNNIQVMSHLMREFKGKINLIYIDPPFDSKADYKRKIELRGKKAESDFNVFEEKMYGDIWSNDEYLQFMYERLIIMRELLSDKGSIYLHCDYHKNHHLRMIMDEVFGQDNLRNEIIWNNMSVSGFKGQANKYIRGHDTIYYYTKSNNFIFNKEYLLSYSEGTIKRYNKTDEEGRRYKIYFEDGNERRQYLDEKQGLPIADIWNDIPSLQTANMGDKFQNYPTQKPEFLIERIIKASSNPGDIVFDCFMGSGTTQAVAMKLGRKFIGSDINNVAIQITINRLKKIKEDLENSPELEEKKYTSFRLFNVNNYDFFNNEVQAKELLIEALCIQKEDSNSYFDGTKDGRMVKIMPVNMIASKADISALTANLPYKEFDKIKEKNPHEVVLYITLVCMGHEPDLKAELVKQLSNYKIDVEIVDILKDNAVLELKREAEADVQRKGNKLIIKKFFPMNLMQKLSLEKTMVSEWKELVDSVMIDFNFDGVEMQPKIIDVPEKNDFVKGEYDIPNDAGRIKVRITDLISESFEIELE